MGTIYLLHFSERLHHAGHYLGYTEDLGERLERHRSGNGARLVEVVTQAGITWTLARTWPGGRDLERRLKRQKNGPRLCPICQREEVITDAIEPMPAMGSAGTGPALSSHGRSVATAAGCAASGPPGPGVGGG